MANKHVVNPCDNSGKAEGLEEVISGVMAIAHGPKGVQKALCPVCNNMVTVNKKSLVFRKHSRDTK